MKQEQPSCDSLRESAEKNDRRGIPLELCTYPGPHEGDVWRHTAGEFLQKLLKA